MQESKMRELVELAATHGRGTDTDLQASELRLAVEAASRSVGVESPTTLRRLAQQLLERNRSRIEQMHYPSAVQELTAKEFDRIEEWLDKTADEAITLQSHRFRCDLRILAFGRIPVGPEHLEVDGLPRSVLTKRGPGQFCSALALAVAAGGFQPFYSVHLAYGHDPATFLFSYSKRAQKKMFLRVAECLRQHPHVKGLLSGSWWHDPEIDRVAPHLSYLRTGWTEHGAKLFFWESTPDIVATATRNSPARKELFERGEYQPKAYMAVWPRRSLLHWAEKNRKSP